MCFCKPLLCYLTTDIRLYCKSQYCALFLTSLSTEAEKEPASKHSAHECINTENNKIWSHNFITPPPSLKPQSLAWQAEVAAIYFNGSTNTTFEYFSNKYFGGLDTKICSTNVKPCPKKSLSYLLALNTSLYRNWHTGYTLYIRLTSFWLDVWYRHF